MGFPKDFLWGGATAVSYTHLDVYKRQKYGLQKQGENIDDMIIRTRSQSFHQSIQQRFILGSLALKQENQEKMFRKAQQVRRLIVLSLIHI